MIERKAIFERQNIWSTEGWWRWWACRPCSPEAIPPSQGSHCQCPWAGRSWWWCCLAAWKHFWFLPSMIVSLLKTIAIIAKVPFRSNISQHTQMPCLSFRGGREKHCNKCNSCNNCNNCQQKLVSLNSLTFRGGRRSQCWWSCLAPPTFSWERYRQILSS